MIKAAYRSQTAFIIFSKYLLCFFLKLRDKFDLFPRFFT